MRNILLPIFIVFVLNNCPDPQRLNCREELDFVNSERDGVLLLLAQNNAKNDPTDKTLPFIAARYLILNEKSLELERTCDNDLLNKLTWPEADDFK